MFFGLFKTFDEKVQKVIHVVDSGKSKVVRYPISTGDYALAYMLESMRRYGKGDVSKYFCTLYIDKTTASILNEMLNEQTDRELNDKTRN